MMFIKKYYYIIYNMKHKCIKYTEDWVNKLKYKQKKYFNKYKLIDKITLGLSPTLVYVIQNKKTKQKYLLKIFGVKNNKKYNYKRVFNELYMNCHMSNNYKTFFPKYYEIGIINNLNLFNDINKKQENIFYPFMISEYLDNYVTIYKYLKNLKNINEKIKLSIIFYLIYHIYILNKKFKFTHNDLHGNNILINNKNKTHIIKYNNKKYKLLCPNIKLIDLDKVNFTNEYNNKHPIKSFTIIKNIFKLKPLKLFKLIKFKKSNIKDIQYLYSLLLLFDININNIDFKNYKNILDNNIFNSLIIN